MEYKYFYTRTRYSNTTVSPALEPCNQTGIQNFQRSAIPWDKPPADSEAFTLI